MMTKLKLSELPDNDKVSIEVSHTKYTVSELKREILELREPHHESRGWVIVTEPKWRPGYLRVVLRLLYGRRYI
jgi:hypothetical protein